MKGTATRSEVNLNRGIEGVYDIPDIEHNDPVSHPSHYTKGGVECIDAIKASMTEEAFKGFLKGNIMKYVYRYESKSKPLEDLKKAKWYLEKLISEVEQNNG